MKFDSHIKITTAAIRLLKSRCPRSNGCDVPLFKEESRAWADAAASVRRDNYSSAALPSGRAAYLTLVRKVLPFGETQAQAVGDLIDRLFPNDLAHWVSAVDVNQAWTHAHAEGQKYHFQRRAGGTQYGSYKEALGFIHYHTSEWVNHVKRLAGSHSDPLARANFQELQRYKFELSLALHSLQDSFSTGHTVRRRDPDFRPWAAPAIVELTVYAEQDSGQHGNEDYVSGGLTTGTGRMAVEASADLISMGITSIAAKTGLVGWDRFVAKWLSERIDRTEQPPQATQTKAAAGAGR